MERKNSSFTPSLLIVLAVLISALILSACGGGGGTGPATGTLSLDVTDAPVDDATRVVVEFTGVEIQPQDGQRLVFNFEPRQIDLLALTGSASEPLLEEVTLSAGAYNFILLKVNAERQTMDSFIEFADGSQFPLFVPSGAQQGLRLVSGFTVTAGGHSDFTIDFDLRKSVHRPGGPTGTPAAEQGLDDYFLRPALRLVDNNEAGHLAGTVLVGDVACLQPAVYVYEGKGAEPNDLCTACEVEETVDRPLTTTLAALNDEGIWEYEVGFLAAGEYTAALTCDEDEPETDEEVDFLEQHDVVIVAGETTVADFDVSFTE